MSDDHGIRVLRTLVGQFDELDMLSYDKATLEKVADMAGELAGKLLKERGDEQAKSFPATLVRPCCVGKDCGTTKLYLDTTEYPDGTIYYAYLRQSNDEEYGRQMNEIEMTKWLAETE